MTTEALPDSTQILDWLERNHTLHFRVNALYVVDGYEAEIVRDEHVLVSNKGECLRSAYAGLMRWEFNPETRTMEKVK